MNESRSVLPPHKSLMKSFKQKETKLTKVGFLGGCPESWFSSLSFCFIATCFSIFCATGLAQDPDSVAEREIQRRQSSIPQGEAALARGKTALQAKNITLAHEEFKTAVRYLPDAVVSGKAHDEAVEGFCKTGVILAEARIAQGDYAGAEAILSEILSNRYDPNCRAAQELLSALAPARLFQQDDEPGLHCQG